MLQDRVRVTSDCTHMVERYIFGRYCIGHLSSASLAEAVEASANTCMAAIVYTLDETAAI